MATWQPQPQGLSDLLQLLKEAVNPNASQTAITEVRITLLVFWAKDEPFDQISGY
jgi:hypothetical protein